MADGENRIVPLEDESDQMRYRHGVQQFIALVNNNAQVHQQRPDDMHWRIQRAKTIKTLNELRQKLDAICVGANYAKVIGSGAQISGSVTAIIGAIMALGKSPSSATIMSVGRLLNNSGSLVGGVSNIVDSYVSAEYLREIKAILEKDKELSQPIQEWLTFSRSLDTSMQIIFGSDLNSIIKNNVLKVFAEFTVLYNSTRGFNATLAAIQKGEYAMHIGTDVTIDKLLKFSKGLDMSPELGETIIKLGESFRFIQVAKDGLNVCQKLFGDNSSIADNPRTISNGRVDSPRTGLHQVSTNPDEVVISQGDDESLDMGLSTNAPIHAESPSVKAVSAFCAFQTIDIAASFVSLISASMFIRDGKSTFSDAIKQISDLLEAELRSIEQFN